MPQLGPEWAQVADDYLGHPMVVVGPGVKTGMAIRINNPSELGADRLVNAVAAFDQLGGPCIVVDFGTATTYDAVSAEGDYLGGIIAPGVEISVQALTERAAKLPRIDLEPPDALIGKSTVEAIRSGVIYGFAGQVDGILQRMHAELGAGAGVIATGGLDGYDVSLFSTRHFTGSITKGSANASARFFSIFANGGSHAGRLSGAELRLLSEWVDIGAQFYNNPFDAPLN